MRPMLATPTEHVPAGVSWLHEVKWDGMRVLADVHDGRLRLSSRTEADVSVSFPELSGLAQVVADAHLDGEVVVLRDGRPSFAALAARMHVTDPRRAARLARTHPVTYLAFDLLRLYGVDLTHRTLEERRASLGRLDLGDPAEAPWQVPPAYDDGPALLAATREHGLEGVVSKRRSSTYQPGRRSHDWLKLAHRSSLSVVVGGWRPEVGASRVGALLVGVPDGGGGGLLYLGRVGSGLTGAMAATLTPLLADGRREDTPFVEVPRVDASGTLWVDPTVVVEVRHLGRTSGGRLRQPVLLGLRADLTPADLDDGTGGGSGG